MEKENTEPDRGDDPADEVDESPVPDPEDKERPRPDDDPQAD